MKLLSALLALALVGCGSAATPQPSSPPGQKPNQYVVDGFAYEIEWYYLVTATCTERPTSREISRAVCDLSDLQAVAMTYEEWLPYQMGDPYPAINP